MNLSKVGSGGGALHHAHFGYASCQGAIDAENKFWILTHRKGGFSLLRSAGVTPVLQKSEKNSINLQ